MPSHRHVGIAEIASLLRLSRQRVHVLREHDDFPAPADELACGPIWHETDVLKWEAQRQPNPGGRPKGTAE